MYVYILKTVKKLPAKYYIGITNNLKKRLEEHNAGRSKFTSGYGQWAYKNIFWFDDKTKACAFERYLKSGSGRAFSNKHF